jgi:hypothetical protein
MNNTASSSGCSKFLGSAVVMGVLTIIGLLLAVYTFYKNNQDTQKELDNQTIQLAYQQTQIALADQQNQLQSQQLTLAAQQGQILTPNPSDNGNFPLTATAFFVQATQIEATSQAIAARQKSIEATQTAIASQPTPSTVIRAEDIIPKIKGEDGSIQKVLSWWREVDYGGNDGLLDASSYAGYECFGMAWNTNQYGYHRLVVFQKSTSFSFADGGWYVKVCAPDSVIISAEDVGKIQADWLGKRYGIDNNPWQVIVSP